MMGATRTHMQGALEFAGVDQITTGRTLAPNVVRHVLLPVVCTTSAKSRLTPENQFSHDEIAGPPRHNPSSEPAV